MSYNQPAYGRQSLAQDQSLDYQQQQREQPYRPPSPAPSQARPTSPPVSSFYVQALYAYSGADTSSLSFRQGDIIEVLSTLASGWWDGVICEEKVRGWFPSNYVQRISEEEATWAREQMAGWWDGREDGERRGSGEYGSGDDMDRNQRALEDLMRGDDPHNFSSGGNIFSEIAAAAQATSSGVEEDEYGAYGRRDAESIYQEASPYRRESVGREGEDDDEEDFWVPKVTTSGQLFYYNPRTGETSRYMPIDGEGDGVQIHPNDFAPEGDEERGAKGKGVAAADSADSGWSAKLTPDGSAVFYENSKTGERSWSPPPTSRFHQQARPQSSTSSYAPSNDHLTFPQASHGGRGSTGDASVIPGWTARAVGTGDADAVSLGKAETLRRGSANSDDSALDGDYEQEDPREPIRPQVEQQKSERPTGSPRRTKTKGRKTVATAELLAPSPPPLLVDLEQLVGTSLRNILEQVGSDKQDGSETADPTLERDRIAALGDSVVEAVRTLLHASGVLEQVATSPSPADAPFTNEIATSHPPTSALSHAAQVELRPATRRITSTLSKLVLSVRAVWGLLETVSEDQLLESNEIPAEGPEEEARREELHQQTLAGWARAREARLEMEGKLRSEVLNGAREVQNCVGSFVADLERVLSASAALIGAPQVPKALLRTPKALQGSLRTNAAALLLPGGGFGGNWRGNGFVTLPTPNSTPNLPSSVEGASTLAYAYPSRPVNSDVAAHLQQDSTLLLDEAETMRTLVTSLFPPSPPANANASTSRTATSSSPTSLTQAFRQLDLSPNRLVDQAAQLQRQIALFLSKVEDIDVAASVDFELAGDAQSRPGSRRDTASGSGSISTSGKRSDAESVLDPPAAEYRSSVKEARPILAELEISKQALYDIAPALLASLQELYMSHAAHKTGSPTSGPQLLSTSPLAFFSASTKVEFGPDTLLGVLSDLKSAVDALCATFSSLGTIADVQAAAPGDLRRLSLAFRSSLFDSHASFTEDPRGSGLQRQGSMSESIPSRSQASSGSHSRPDEDSERRESVDSDFFFPAGAQSTTSGTVGSKGSTKTSQLFSPSGAGWEERRDSVATSASSAMSDSLPHRRELPLRLVTDVDPVSSVTSPTRTTPSKSKLAKILGADPSQEDMRGRLPTEPLPAWLGPDYGPDEVSFNLEGQIKGGTLRALVIAAASHEGRVDSNYLSAFLMTYRTFCTSHQLLDFLIARFLIEPPTGLNPEQMQTWETRKQRPIKARVANVIKSWVREHMDHDEFDADLLRRIADFASSTMRDPVQSPQIIKAVEDRLSGATRRQGGNLAPGILPPSIIPRNLRKLKFMDIDPLELARQLTLMDGERFAKITPQECLGKAWPKEYGSDAPNISKMIDLSNCVTRWVTETILGQDDLKKRANTIKQFIAVAERCLALNNFSTLIHIIAGLNSTPIHRLRRTWETVNQKAMISLGMLNNIMRPDKNYKEYREALRGVAPPCVPFLGVYLTDWTFIGDGNPDMLREKPHQINFNKRQKASELILMIKLHQSTTYNLAAVPLLKKFLETQLFTPSADPAMDDQRLYEISLTREPRERDDEKIARLLSESGFL